MFFLHIRWNVCFFMIVKISSRSVGIFSDCYFLRNLKTDLTMSCDMEHKMDINVVISSDILYMCKIDHFSIFHRPLPPESMLTAVNSWVACKRRISWVYLKLSRNRQFLFFVRLPKNSFLISTLSTGGRRWNMLSEGVKMTISPCII